MSSPISGKYELISSENFDEFLQALGINFFLRKMAKITTPTEIYSANVDGSFTYRMLSTFKNQEYTFRLGEPFRETRLDGKTVFCVITMEGVGSEKGDGNILILKQYETEKCENLICTIRRVFSRGDETRGENGTGTGTVEPFGLEVTFTCKEIVARRQFKRLE